MTINNRIEGLFRLTRPLHCASPDKSLVRSDNANETPTMQMRLVTASGLQTIPYFPGNDLRGRLRRKAAAIVLDHITVSGKVKMELYAGLNCGAISASPDSAGLTIEEALRARDNVYMGLFGGGARLLRSRFRVADLVPVIGDTIELGMVPREFADQEAGKFLPVVNATEGQKAASGWQLVQSTQVLRVDDVLRVLRSDEIEKYIADKNAVARYQSEILNASSARKAEKSQAKAGEIKKTDISKKVGVGNIAVFQSILAGTPMYLLLDLADDTSDAHVGLMLLALQDLVREQALGGWIRAGLGQFRADLSLTRHGEQFRVFADGKDAADAHLAIATDQFTRAAKQALTGLVADDMMAFFIPRSDTVGEAA